MIHRPRRELKLKAYLIVLLLLLCGSPVIAETEIRSLRDVTNNHVHWHRSHLGHPFPLVSVETDFMEALERDSSSLLPLLNDPQRFIAAHALLGLSRWNFLEFQDKESPGYFMFSDHNFGPLEVFLRKDGTTFIDPKQIEKVSDFWHNRYRPRK